MVGPKSWRVAGIWFSWFIWFVWFLWFVWCRERNKRDKPDRPNKPVRLPLNRPPLTLGSYIVSGVMDTSMTLEGRRKRVGM